MGGLNSPKTRVHAPFIWVVWMCLGVSCMIKAANFRWLVVLKYHCNKKEVIDLGGTLLGDPVSLELSSHMMSCSNTDRIACSLHHVAKTVLAPFLNAAICVVMEPHLKESRIMRTMLGRERLGGKHGKKWLACVLWVYPTSQGFVSFCFCLLAFAPNHLFCTHSAVITDPFKEGIA